MADSAASKAADSGDGRRRVLREAFIAERGFWALPFEAILDADPDFFAAYLELSSVPTRHGYLEPKVSHVGRRRRRGQLRP